MWFNTVLIDISSQSKLKLRGKQRNKIVKSMRIEIRHPNAEKRVENTTYRGVFLTNFEVFRNTVKHGPD